MLRLLLTVLTLCFFLPAQSVLAQGVVSQTTVSDMTAPMSELLKEASDSGMTVIIMDPTGVPANANTGSDAEPMFEAKNASGTLLMRAQMQVDDFRDLLNQRLNALPAAVNEVLFVLRASSPDGSIFAFAKELLYVLCFLAIGVLVERKVYGQRLIGPWVMARIKDNPIGYSERLPYLLLRFVGGLGGVIVSIVVAGLVGALVRGPAEDSAIRFTVITIFAAYGLCRIVALAWRMILSPYLEQYRIPALTTPDARKLHNWVFLLSAFDISTLFFGEWLKELGLNYNVYALMTLVLISLFALLNVAMIIANRSAISGALRNGRSADQVSMATRWLSFLWAPIFVIYVALGWARMAFELVLELPTSIPLIAGSYAILTSIIVVYATINFAIERFFERTRRIRAANAAMLRAQENDDKTAHEIELASNGDIELENGDDVDAKLLEFHQTMSNQSIHSFEGLARRVAGILAVITGGYAALLIFGADQYLEHNSYYNKALDVAVILFWGYIAFHAFRIWVDTKIQDEMGEVSEVEPGDEGGASGASRLATLLPLFRSLILIVIVVSIALIALLELGVNVSPLFAGAGVVGLAVGFGSQSLVRDIFSGAFFLFDDAFRKGEYIDIGLVKGTVEKISVRSFQLRHHLGPLHTVPFGEIQYLTNYSRDWVIMKLKLRVTYDTDVEHVRKLVKNLGVELLDDPVIGHNFIQPLKSQGVVEMQDSAMIIRVKFMTKPGDQWLVRKKVYQDLRDLFAREGIKFAHREVTVRLADGKQTETLTPNQREAVTGAAQAAIDEDALDEMGGDDR